MASVGEEIVALTKRSIIELEFIEGLASKGIQDGKERIALKRKLAEVGGALITFAKSL